MTAPATDEALWLRRYRPAPEAAARLLCFPHAGGSASYFRPMAEALAPRVEVVAVQYPGRQDRFREPCLDSVADLVDRVQPLVASWSDRPLVLFGHSMGSLLAFELALRLRDGRSGPPVAHLFASGRRGPSTVREETPVHTLDDDGILDDLARLGGTDLSLLEDAWLRRTVIDCVRADYRAIETYPCPPDAVLDCPVTVLVGDDDPKTTLEEAGAWRSHTTGPFARRVFPGGHFYLSERWAEVCAVLGEAFDGIAAGAVATRSGSE
ncbi:thioesterase II family protein [Allostreptomyces psammosilenae]|uniref:Surfactin synthase thioesterase subunit n=1 Tax=Allostreptomyces psammosilenae TaxID=1892865 RepID=A0A852ZQ46_9ACTN|nr:alpha/beta fold hydrolase [Allostreptomyces psammosilenae]NYI03617.1 surfactin synthase thioesterase subunit [Allostreptomyces psammosilenae]